MDTQQLIKIHEALQSPTHRNRVSIALRIINNFGKLPLKSQRQQYRTYLRIKKRLVQEGII